MPENKPLRDSLKWAKESREQWLLAYQQAVEDKHSEDANFATKQVAMFDRMIERLERLMKKRVPGYKSGE